MAGPTPVSALIHAATMVAAGVYMVARSNILFVLAPATLTVVAVTGLATALFAASIAIYQNDIKKILAYSTISQLGLYVPWIGHGCLYRCYVPSDHSCFLQSASVSWRRQCDPCNGRGTGHPENGRIGQFPAENTMGISHGNHRHSRNPAIFGILFKRRDFLFGILHSIPLWIIAVIGAMMTAFYMFRLYFLTFHGKFRGTVEQKQHLHESPSIMIIPLVILAILSVAGGVIDLPGFTGGSARLQSFLAPVFAASMPFLKAPVYALDHSYRMVAGRRSASFMWDMMILVAWSPLPEKRTGDTVRPWYKNYSFHDFFLINIISTNFTMHFLSGPLKLSKGFHEVIEKGIIDKFVNWDRDPS